MCSEWVPGRVFGIGYPKSGTTSLLLAMEILGWPRETIAFTPKDPDSRDAFRESVPALIRKNVDAGNPPMHGLPYLVAADRVHAYYEALADAYNDAKFIITYRDPHEIALSAWRHAKRQIDTKDHYPESWKDYAGVISAATSHYQSVMSFALRDDIRDRTLLLRICDRDGWETLCPFLGVPIPDRKFPAANTSS